LEANNHLVIAPPKPDIKNSITYFVDQELKMLRMMDNNEEWCEKNQARCYVV
jgi:hypothetical protein